MISLPESWQGSQDGGQCGQDPEGRGGSRVTGNRGLRWELEVEGRGCLRRVTGKGAEG